MAACQAREEAEENFLSLAAMADQRWEAAKEKCECLVHALTLLSLMGYELCMTIIGAPPLAPYMRECALRWPSTSRWPRVYPRFVRRCLWPPSPYLGACLLMLPKRVLWVTWLPGFGREQSDAHVSRLLTQRSVTLFLGQQTPESIWSLLQRRLPGDIG
jgi:hypothetical protein